MALGEQPMALGEQTRYLTTACRDCRLWIEAEPIISVARRSDISITPNVTVSNPCWSSPLALLLGSALASGGVEAVPCNQ